MEVLLIDDHPIVQEILPAIVRKAFGKASVHIASNLEDGFKIARQQKAIDLVMLDLGLPGCVGEESLRRFREEHPSLKVVVVSAATDRHTILASFRLGATGYVPKTSKPSVIVAALQIVAGGGTYVPSEILSGPTGDKRRLSDREMDVMRLMLTGLSNADIANKLAIADSTVKQHMASIYASLGVHTRAQAMAAAARQGHRGTV